MLLRVLNEDQQQVTHEMQFIYASPFNLTLLYIRVNIYYLEIYNKGLCKASW